MEDQLALTWEEILFELSVADFPLKVFKTTRTRKPVLRQGQIRHFRSLEGAVKLLFQQPNGSWRVQLIGGNRHGHVQEMTVRFLRTRTWSVITLKRMQRQQIIAA